MAAYCWVNDSRHLQADCQALGSAPEPYARQSSMGYLFYHTATYLKRYGVHMTLVAPECTVTHPQS